MNALRPLDAFLCLGLALGSLGCAASHGRDSDGSGGSAPGTTAPVIHIPMLPATEMEQFVQVDGEIDFDGVEAPFAESRMGLTLALGEGYPRSVEVHLAGVYRARCEGPEGAIRIESITGGGDGLSVERLSPASFAVRADGEEGDATLHIRGTFVADAPFVGRSCWDVMAGRSRLDFDLAVSVRSREIGGVELEPRAACDEGTPAFFTGTSLEGLRYHALDRVGERLRLANADAQQPVDLEISTRDGSNLSLEGLAVIDNVWLPDATTIVEVAAPAGAPALLDVVDPARVNELEAHFEIYGRYGPSMRLMGGASIDGANPAMEDLGDRIYLTLEGAQQVEGRTVCSSVPPDRFILESSSPATCTVLERSEDELERPSYVGAVVQGAELVGNGPCSLRWRAPTLGGGAGLEGGIDISVSNVGELEDLSE